jgi:hypothetical protein
MSIETILSWPAFAVQSPVTYLKSLLNPSDVGPVNYSRADVIHPDVRYDELLQRFLDNVFIYNPVLEESTLHQFVREIEFHGFSFDAKSCLLVSTMLLIATSPNQYSYSSMQMDV